LILRKKPLDQILLPRALLVIGDNQNGLQVDQIVIGDHGTSAKHVLQQARTQTEKILQRAHAMESLLEGAHRDENTALQEEFAVGKNVFFAIIVDYFDVGAVLAELELHGGAHKGLLVGEVKAEDLGISF
jgi:hypothetical protein